MKDFDIERRARVAADRKFRIGGEEFVRVEAVRPEAIAEWENFNAFGKTLEDIFETVDRTVKVLIEPGERGEAHRRWDELRKRTDNPITKTDLIGVTEPNEVTGVMELVREGLVHWLIAECSGRPTEPPEPSTNGRGSGETQSTEGSSSRASKAASKG